MFFCHGANGIHIRTGAENMHRQNRFRSVRNLLLNFGRIHIETVYLYIDKNGNRTHLSNTFRRKKGSLLFQGEIKTLTSKAKRKVEISTDDNARAFAILRSHAFPMLRNERDGLEVEIADQDRFSEMISLLAAIKTRRTTGMFTHGTPSTFLFPKKRGLCT